MESTISTILSSKTAHLIEVLDNNPSHSQIILLGDVTLKDKTEPEHFILKLKKKEFDPKDMSIEVLNQICSSPSQYFNNDIYTKYISKALAQNEINIELIYPCTQKNIDKFRAAKFEIITETYEMYKNKTLAYINSFDKNHIQWIHNILYKKAEKPLIEDESYVILKNYTSVNNPDILDCLGLPYNGDDIKSLRDLTDKHLPLLVKFSKEGREKIAELFKCKPSEIRAFVHYPPSFYYFHVHYINVNIEDFSTTVNRAIDLNEIIENIKMKKDYYQTVSIDHTVKIGSKLYDYLTNKSICN